MEIVITHKGLVKPGDAKKTLEKYGFSVDKLLTCECWTTDNRRCAQDDPNLGYVSIKLKTSMNTDEIVNIAKKLNKKSILIEYIMDTSKKWIYDSED